ncbi:MAG: DUF58 domain-containing protein [Planctomycetes bacterium]|nr:DUF58 domain-containing protein [Planctomycetota bacterium]
MRIRPTELGCKGLLLLGALLLAFYATAYSNLFFLLVAFCCVLGGFGAVSGMANLRGCRVTIGELPLAAAGASRSLRVELHTGGRSVLDLAVELRLCGKWLEVAHVETCRDRVVLTCLLPPAPRGVQPVRSVQLATRQPFGFFTVRRSFAIDAELITHPDPRLARAGAPRGRGGAGDQSAQRGTAGASWSSLRPFRTGDAPNAVHWPATARRGTPISRERDPEAGHDVVLRIDRRQPADVFERTLASATEQVLQARSGNRRLRLVSQDTDLRVTAERGSERSALRWLATALPLPADAPPPPHADHHAHPAFALQSPRMGS